MCRQYYFNFILCGHIVGHSDWYFPCAQPWNCQRQDIIENWGTQCLDCDLAAFNREAFRYGPLLAPNPEAEHVFARAEGLRHTHPIHCPACNDPQCFQALSIIQPRLSQLDRLWVERMENELDVLIRWMYIVDGRRRDDVTTSLQYLILQLRWANLTSYAAEQNGLAYRANAFQRWTIWARNRMINRIRRLLTDVPANQLGQEDMCPICYTQWLHPIEGNLFVVRTPCGHVFCRACIEHALQLNNRNCPACRRDFGLMAIEQNDLAFIDFEMVILPPSTPWWIRALRGW